WQVSVGRCEEGSDVGLVRGDFLEAGEESGGVVEMTHGDGVDAGHDAGLGGVIRWEDEPAIAHAAGGDGHGEGALDGTHGAIEGEFADDGVVLEALAAVLPAGGE